MRNTHKEIDRKFKALVVSSTKPNMIYKSLDELLAEIDKPKTLRIISKSVTSL